MSIHQGGKFQKKNGGVRPDRRRDLPEAAHFDAVKAMAAKACGVTFSPVDSVPGDGVQFGYGVKTTAAPVPVYHPDDRPYGRRPFPAE